MEFWKKEIVIDTPDLPNPDDEENGLVTVFIGEDEDPDEEGRVEIITNEDEGGEAGVSWTKDELLKYLLTKLGYKRVDLWSDF